MAEPSTASPRNRRRIQEFASRIENRANAVRDADGKILRNPQGIRVEVEVLDIGSKVVNPQLVEMFLAVRQPDGTPEAWVAAVHQRRGSAAHFDDGTLMPLSMYHAVRVGEYLFPEASWTAEPRTRVVQSGEAQCLTRPREEHPIAKRQHAKEFLPTNRGTRAVDGWSGRMVQPAATRSNVS
jgi:hypothetical protein